MSAPAELDLDLPCPPSDRGRPSRSPWLAAALVGVLAVVAGAVLQDRWAGRDGPAPPRVSAWLAMEGVRLTDRPRADLHLEVTSRDDVTVYLTGLQLGGGGAVPQHQDLWRPLTPGLVEDLHLPTELNCPPGAAVAPLRLTLTVTRTPAAPRTVTAVADPGCSCPAGSAVPPSSGSPRARPPP